MANRSKPSFAETIRNGWKPPKRRARESKAAPRKAAANGTVGDAALEKKRDALQRDFAELQWDLGGMAYEMASRDHYRLDVLNKQAAKLQQVDAELGQVERMLKMEEGGASGSCPSCGALQARGAVFCWQCGNELKPPTSPKPKAQSKPKGASRAKKAAAKR